jgi:hypothetical protein
LLVPHREIALSTTGHSDRNEENRASATNYSF